MPGEKQEAAVLAAVPRRLWWGEGAVDIGLRAKEGVTLYVTLCIELRSLRDRRHPFHWRSAWWASTTSPGIETEADESPMNLVLGMLDIWCVSCWANLIGYQP